MKVTGNRPSASSLAQRDVMLEVIDLGARVLAEHLEDLLVLHALQVVNAEQPVAARSHVAVRIHLPARARVLLFVFYDREVGVTVRRVSGRLAEEQQIFRHAGAHARAVFALLSPTQPIGLIVFAHHVGHDGFAPEEGEAVLGEIPMV
jgi:hypothetical protein